MKAERAFWKKILPSAGMRKEGRLHRILLAAASFVLVYLLLVLVTIPSRINLEVGRPSRITIYAPRDVVDEHATEMLRRAAEEAVPEVFDYQPEVAEEALAAVKGFFKECLDLQGNAELPQEEKVKALREEGSFEGLADSVLLSLLTADPGTVQELQRRLEDTLTKSFEEGIKANELEAAWQEVSQAIALFPYSADLKRISEKLVEPLIRPNLILNQAATQQNREKARQAVEPVVLLRGTLIISEGETVTEKHLAQLESLGLLKGGSTDYPAYIGLFLFLLVVFVMVGIYLSIFVKNVFKNAALILLLGIVVLVTLIFAIAATYFSGFLIPVSIGVLLIAVMFGARLALIMNVVFALMVALVTGGDFGYFAVARCGGLAAIYGVSRVSQRGDSTGLCVAGQHGHDYCRATDFWQPECRSRLPGPDGVRPAGWDRQRHLLLGGGHRPFALPGERLRDHHGDYPPGAFRSQPPPAAAAVDQGSGDVLSQHHGGQPG